MLACLSILFHFAPPLINSHILPALQQWLCKFGLIGIFILALTDSSLLFLFPGVVDLALISFVIVKGDWIWALTAVLLALLGSLIGGRMMIYGLGNRGGGDRLYGRLSIFWQNRIRHWTERYGSLPVGITALLAPPCPYAPFVVIAGILGLPLRHFYCAVAAGRGARYGFDAVFALTLGLYWMHHWRHDIWVGSQILVTLAVVSIAAFGIYRKYFYSNPSPRS